MNHADRVPWTASWSSEERLFVAKCPYAMNKPAICQPESPGFGRPLFATPHSIRQRKAIVECLCDLCGQPIAGDRISLSFDRKVDVGFVQAEPLLHGDCAAISIKYCPHLKRHAAAGSICIRQVHQYQVAIARLTSDAVYQTTGKLWPDGAVYGHAKILICDATIRDMEWLNVFRSHPEPIAPSPLGEKQ